MNLVGGYKYCWARDLGEVGCQRVLFRLRPNDRSVQSLHVWLSPTHRVLRQGLSQKVPKRTKNGCSTVVRMSDFRIDGVRYRAHFGANKSESYFQLDSRADFKRLQAHSWNFTMFWQNFYTRLHMNSVKHELLTRWRGHCVEDMCPRTAWCCPCLSEGDFNIYLF